METFRVCQAALHLTLLALLCGCSAEISKVADDVLTDKAISLEVEKEAFGKETDLHVVIDVVNKDAKKI